MFLFVYRLQNKYCIVQMSVSNSGLCRGICGIWWIITRVIKTGLPRYYAVWKNTKFIHLSGPALQNTEVNFVIAILRRSGGSVKHWEKCAELRLVNLVNSGNTTDWDYSVSWSSKPRYTCCCAVSTPDSLCVNPVLNKAFSTAAVNRRLG